MRFGLGLGLGFVQTFQIDLDLVINISVFLRVNLWLQHNQTQTRIQTLDTKSKPEFKPNSNHEITNPKALGLLHPYLKKRAYLRFGRFLTYSGFLHHILVTQLEWDCSPNCSLSNETPSSSKARAVHEKIAKYWAHPLVANFIWSKWTL
jgi:hypothetical protein